MKKNFGSFRYDSVMPSLTHRDLEPAISGGIITAEQAERLIIFFGEPRTITLDKPRFTFVHVLYYLGGMIAIGAMSLFMTLGWNALGGWGGCFTAVCYGAVALGLTHKFLDRRLPIPAGIMATLAVVMVPLAIFGAQMALGYWGEGKSFRDYHVFIDWRWIMMEIGTLAAGAVLLWRYRFPFMVMPIAVTLWYMSMDLVPFFNQGDYSWELRKLVSLYFSLAMTLLAFWVDVRSRRAGDYAFWLYLFGVMTFWCGLSSLNSNSELNKLIYCGINIAMILLGAILGRRVFAVFGGLGIAGYLGHLSYRVFKDSLMFPFALSLIGLAIIWLGVIWQRHEADWSVKLRGYLPRELKELVEARRS